MAETGSLRIRVFTSAAQLPLEGATVVVTQLAPSGRHDLISVQRTDSSGIVRPITISTPSSSQSTSPSNSPSPFALCDAWAELPGYRMGMTRDIQIFPGVETIQEFQLVPLYEAQPNLVFRDARVTLPHDL